MLGQWTVMIFWTLKSIVVFIRTDFTFVQLVLTLNEAIFIPHHAEQPKVHVTRF